ncbi:hypothetical protein DFO54_104270 [Erwinia sp. AG740]|nr:hypothetical protein DFO54_104270 [Erwinia sp. AG740]
MKAIVLDWLDTMVQVKQHYCESSPVFMPQYQDLYQLKAVPCLCLMYPWEWTQMLQDLRIFILEGLWMVLNHHIFAVR